MEDTYAGPALFGGGAGRALCRFYASWADVTLVSGILRFIALDILERLHDMDREYFSTSREERFGMTLEDLVAGREARLPAFRQSLTPLRLALKAQAFLGGDRPLYADYAVFGPFQWARCVSPFALLAPDDPISLWREKLLDAFEGLARRAPGYDI